MVVPQSVLDTLKSIGLNLYERKLWVALLSRGTATAGELSALAKVPRSRTYDVLESLADKGFVVIQNSKPIKYVAVPPKEALERAKKKILSEAEETAKRMDELKSSSAIKELEKVYKDGVKLIEPGSVSGSIKGRDAVHNQLGTVFKSAKERVSIVATPSTLKEIHETHGRTLKKLSSKGVKIRIAVPDHPEVREIKKEVKEYAELRKLSDEHPKGRFAIVDGKHVIMALTEDNIHPTQDVALWTSSEHAASLLEPMFEHVWEHLEPA